MRPQRMNTSPCLVGRSEGEGTDRVGAVSQGLATIIRQLALVLLCLKNQSLSPHPA